MDLVLYRVDHTFMWLMNIIQYFEMHLVGDEKSFPDDHHKLVEHVR